MCSFLQDRVPGGPQWAHYGGVMEALAGIIRSSVETKGSPWDRSNMSRWIPSERTQWGGCAEWAASCSVHVLRQHVARYEVGNRDEQLCAEGIALRVGVWGRNEDVRNNSAGGNQNVLQMWSLWQCSSTKVDFFFLAYCFKFSSTVQQYLTLA